jgi:hypothetical protein
MLAGWNEFMVRVRVRCNNETGGEDSLLKRS